MRENGVCDCEVAWVAAPVLALPAWFPVPVAPLSVFLLVLLMALIQRGRRV